MGSGGRSFKDANNFGIIEYTKAQSNGLANLTELWRYNREHRYWPYLRDNMSPGMAGIREDSRRAQENFKRTEQKISKAFAAWSKDKWSPKLERGYREAVSQHKENADVWVRLGTRYQQAVKDILNRWDRENEGARAASEQNQWQPAQIAAYENYLQSNTEKIKHWQQGVARSLAAQDPPASGSRSSSHQSHGAQDRPYYGHGGSRHNRPSGPSR